MLRRKNQLYFYFGTILMSIILISISNLPAPKDISKVTIKSGFHQPHEIGLEIPRKIWIGETGRIRIEINNEETGDLIGSSNFKIDQESDDQLEFGLSGNDYKQNIEIDLVLSGAVIDPKGVLITPLIKDQDMIFEWKIDPTGDENILGSIWIYIHSTATKNNEPNNRDLIFTKDIQIKHDHFLGIRMITINWIAIIGFVVSGFLIIRFLKSSGFFGNNILK